MGSVKQEKRLRKQPPVKRNKKAIVISLLLATIGVISAVYLYQYTHTAKLEKQYYEVQSELNNKNSQLESTVQDKANLQKQVEELNKTKQDLEAQLQAKLAERQRIASLAQKTAQASSTKPTGTKTDWMMAAGIPESQWGYVDYIVSRESGWRPTARNVSSGACGLVQALPCSKLGPNWSDPVVALKWQLNYVNARYGGYAGAYAFWVSNHWY